MRFTYDRAKSGELNGIGGNMQSDKIVGMVFGMMGGFIMLVCIIVSVKEPTLNLAGMIMPGIGIMYWKFGEVKQKINELSHKLEGK